MKKLTVSNNIISILLAVILLISAAQVFAATITQTQNFSGIPSMSGALNFNKFNPAFGTLTSIQVGLALQTSGGVLILDNDSTSPASGTFQYGAKSSISSTNVSLLNSSFQPVPGQTGAYHTQSFSLTANAGDGPGDYDPTPTDGMQYNGGIETGSSSGFVNSAVWGGYTGAGTYNIDYSTIIWLDFGSIGGIEYAFSPVSTNGNVSITYTYNIPEPATILLFTLGGLALRKYKK